MQPMETARFGLVVNATAKGVRRRFLDHDPFWQKKLPEEMVSVTHRMQETCFFFFNRNNV